jgi:hypothetical protein
VAVALTWADPPGPPTSVSCETTILGCWDMSTASLLRPALGYVIPCSVLAALLALGVLLRRRTLWWPVAVLASVTASTAVYAGVLA